MDYLVICGVAFVASGLTFFSGFGLGTLLLPALAVFFPVEIAVAMTAVVHLLNNLFKLAIVGRHADRAVVLRFGLPAIAAAFAGAWVLWLLADLPPLVEYGLLGRRCRATVVKVVMAALMIVFAAAELRRPARRSSNDRRWLPLGGLACGFFGGLSGHQGALRSAFLIHAGLSKESFIGTGVVIACLVDAARLAIYAADFPLHAVRSAVLLMAAATGAAVAGALAGARLLRSMTLRHVQIIVSVMLTLVALALGAGIV